jgi:hypothetical protein
MTRTRGPIPNTTRWTLSHVTVAPSGGPASEAAITRRSCLAQCERTYPAGCISWTSRETSPSASSDLRHARSHVAERHAVSSRRTSYLTNWPSTVPGPAAAPESERPVLSPSGNR